MWLTARAQWLLDCVFLGVAVFALIVFPARLAFVGAVSAGHDGGWFAILILTDLVLWADLAARFFTPVSVEGALVFDRRLVARTFLRGSFVVDVAARLPWDVLAIGITGEC